MQKKLLGELLEELLKRLLVEHSLKLLEEQQEEQSLQSLQKVLVSEGSGSLDFGSDRLQSVEQVQQW